ncbi:MAG: hypothetical protein EOP48_14340 [Sphingobacteriales bacterium]|nr:MAG: hypothetical protein EOP48_14340 [Sphingobacteriales bacterium]
MKLTISKCPYFLKLFYVTSNLRLHQLMTGPLAQIISLTTYGNDFIKNGRVPIDFNTVNTTFQFCNKVDFREFKKPFFFSKLKEKVVAQSPTEWFDYLKLDDCKHLRLYFESSKDQSFAKDHKLAGVVGGGGRWLIEANYDGYSNYWANRWKVTNQDAADNKIWGVNYAMTVVKQHISNLQIDNNVIKDKLRHTLTEIAEFAFKQNLQDWGEQFDQARLILDSSSPEDNYYHKDLIPPHNYSLIAKQILFSAGTSWVFGGMGSWNDLGFDRKEDNENYERLSEQLYSTIHEAVISATNTF